jgi:hypothetical protein
MGLQPSIACRERMNQGKHEPTLGKQSAILLNRE